MAPVSANGSEVRPELAGVDVQNLLALSTEDLAQLGQLINSEVFLRKQNANLNSFAAHFLLSIDASFKQNQHGLVSGFVDLVNDLRVLESESATESSSPEFGSIKLSVPGLPEGVTVSRSRDTFSVDEGRSLRERNEIRIKVGGLDAYSGYWLALDAPVLNHRDALQEEGIDTLRRLITATSLPLEGPSLEDALQYPFIAALVSPFGREAILPFEKHLSALHRYYGHDSGGSWFKVSAADLKRTSLEEGGDFLSLTERPRAALSAFEEAELELEKLDL